jgi:hypothetical protein
MTDLSELRTCITPNNLGATMAYGSEEELDFFLSQLKHFGHSSARLDTVVEVTVCKRDRVEAAAHLAKVYGFDDLEKDYDSYMLP